MAALSNHTKNILKIIRLIIQLFLNILLYTIVIIMVLKISRIVYDFSYEIFGNVCVQEEPGTDVPFEIEEGEGTYEMAQKLENMGLIVNKYSFTIRAKLSTSEKRPVLPGSYRLNTSMSYSEIINVITNESEKNQ